MLDFPFARACAIRAPRIVPYVDPLFFLPLMMMLRSAVSSFAPPACQMPVLIEINEALQVRVFFISTFRLVFLPPPRW